MSENIGPCECCGSSSPTSSTQTSTQTTETSSTQTSSTETTPTETSPTSTETTQTTTGTTEEPTTTGTTSEPTTTVTNTTGTGTTGTGTTEEFNCCDTWKPTPPSSLQASLSLDNFASCDCWTSNPGPLPASWSGGAWHVTFDLCNDMTIDLAFSCAPAGYFVLSWALYRPLSAGGCDYSGTENPESGHICTADTLDQTFLVSGLSSDNCCGGGTGVGVFTIRLFST